MIGWDGLRHKIDGKMPHADMARELIEAAMEARP